MFDCIGFENPCVDVSVVVEQLPKPNAGSRVLGLSFQGGGKIASGMIAAARLGANCKIVGAMGDDIFGKSSKEDFIRHGVNVDDFELMENSVSSVSVVLSDMETRGRSIMFRGGDGGKELYERPLTICADAKMLFIAHLGPREIKLCHEAKEKGMQILMDADYPHDGLMENAHLINYFIASEFVYEKLFGNSQEYEKNLKSIYDLGQTLTMFTFGGNGLKGYDKDGYFEMPAFKVEVMDTLGAGDIFHGAYVAALIHGFDTRESARFASAVAAIKCTRQGGRAGIPDFETTMNFLNTGVIDYTEIDKRVEYYKRGLEHA